METCKVLAGERCHAPGREQDRNKPLHENACAPNKKTEKNCPDTRHPAVTQYCNLAGVLTFNSPLSIPLILLENKSRAVTEISAETIHLRRYFFR